MNPFKIFPACVTADRRKIPLIKDWQNLASNDPNQIKLWQELYRERITHWAIPTGRINDLLVLDIDVKPTFNGWKSVKDRGLIIPETMSQKTMNGGSHFLFITRKTAETTEIKSAYLVPRPGSMFGQAAVTFFTMALTQSQLWRPLLG